MNNKASFRIGRSLRIVILLLSLTLFACTTEGQNLELVSTTVIDGLYIGVGCVDHDKISTNHSSTDGHLVIELLSTATNTNYAVFFPTDPEYFCQVYLYDSKGVAVTKTEYGRQFAQKFLKLEANFSPDGPRLRQKRPHNEGISSFQDLFFATTPTMGGGQPYTVEDLFKITNAGLYKLQIRFQIIAEAAVGKTAHVVRFPTLEYPLWKSNPKK